MNKFILKNKLLATTAICAISMCSNTVKAEEISILDILNNSATKSPNISWEKVDTAGTDTIQIDDEYFKYTYTQPADYTEVKDKTEKISVVNPIEEDTYKYIDLGVNNLEGNDYGDIEKYVFSNNKFTATLENNTDYWKELYVCGGVISNQGTIGDITSDFLDNSIEVSVTGDHAYSSANGGAIYNYDTTGKITGNFINNKAIGTAAYGGALHNYNGFINNITADFVNNYVNAIGDNAYGGAIHNYAGTITSITGDFTGNSATGEYAYGGAIYNGSGYDNNGNYVSSIISSITGNFVGNSTTGEYVDGGAILNDGTIETITGDFIGNKATGNYDSYGGAIYNGGSISFITGDFIGNSATATNHYAYGGAIRNGGTVETITGNFIGNNATSSNSYAVGGAISNSGNMNITGNFINNFAISENSTAHGGAIYNNGTISILADNIDILFKGNYVINEGIKIYEAIYNITTYYPSYYGRSPDIGIVNFNVNNNGSFSVYDSINGEIKVESNATLGEDGNVINFTGDGTGTFNLYNNIQNQKDVNFQSAYVMNMLSPDDIHQDVFTSKYSYIQAQNININAALQMMLDVDLKNAEMDRFEADNFTIADNGSINVTKFNIVTDLTGNIGTTTEVDFIVSDNATGLDKITNVTEAVGEVYTYTVTFNPETGAFEFVSTGLAPGYTPPLAPEEVAPNQAPVLTTNTTVAAVETVVAQIFERDVTISADTNYGSDTPYSSERVSEEATSNGVNVANKSNVWVKTFGSDDDLELDNFNGTIDSEAYGIVGGVDSKVFKYDNGVKAAYGVYGAYVGGKQKHDGNKTTQDSGYLGVSASFRKNNLFSNFTLNGGYITSEANTEWGTDKFDTKTVSVANKTGVDIKVGNNWTLTPALYVAYTGLDTEDYTNKAGVKMENEFTHVVTLAPEVKLGRYFGKGFSGYAKASYKHYIYDSEVKADDVVLEEMSAKPYVEYGFGVEKNWADKSGYAEITRRDGGRTGWNINLGLNFDF